MAHGVIVSQPADGMPHRWVLGNGGQRTGSEVLVPLLLKTEPDVPATTTAINISNVYTYINYPKPQPPGYQGKIATEHDITITPSEGSPLVAYSIYSQTIPP